MSVKTHTFPNGFRMVYEQSPSDIPVTYMRTLCDFGSINEPIDSKGAAHFIEHMCFKGTTMIKNSGDLNQIYDKIGAYMNATTDKLHTCYIVKCNSIYFENMARLISDMMMNSKFDEKECVKEEQVVIEENSRNGDDVNDILFSELDKMIYKGSVYEYPVDTMEYHNNNFKYSKIYELYKLFYQPNRMVLSFVQ